MKSTRKLLLSAAFLACPSLSAQRTWVVDANNGTGADFRDLPPAVAAANPGDTIVMRPGLYSGTSIDEGIAILGTPGVTIRAPQSAAYSIRVADIPATQTFRMRDVTLEDQLPLGGTGILEVIDNEGGVHLERVTMRTNRRFLVPLLADIHSSKQVTLSDCTSLTGLDVVSSTVMINGGQYQGMDGVVSRTPVGCSFSKPATAFSVVGSKVWLTQLVARGGNGHSGCSNGLVGGAPAIWSVKSTVTVTGGTILNAGNRSTGAAIVGEDDSHLALDRRVQLNTTPGYSGFKSVSMQQPPVLVASGGRVGSTIHARLFGSNQDLYALYAGAPRRPTQVGNFGDAWLDPTTAIVLGTGVHVASDRVNLNVPIPPLAALRSIPIALQVWGGAPSRGFRFSNARVITLH